MTPEYHVLFPQHIVLGYIALWTILEVVAWRIWSNIRISCKKISLLHCIVAFLISSIWLFRWIMMMMMMDHDDDNGQENINNNNIKTGLYNFELPGTLEHHVVSLSMAYFIVDMPFAVTFHPTFIVHHILCIVAFAAIQGYWKYLPKNTPFFMDFMAWETTPKTTTTTGEEEIQLLLGGTNGVFNLWMAELGGIFFHINRAFVNTDYELPSRGLFLFMFTMTRCFLWPVYLYQLYQSASSSSSSSIGIGDEQQEQEEDPMHAFHKASAVLETGLFVTNLHFLYKNVAPIWKTGRLMPSKPEGFHRTWLDRHPMIQNVVGLFLCEEKISMTPSSSRASLLVAATAASDQQQKTKKQN